MQNIETTTTDEPQSESENNAVQQTEQTEQTEQETQHENEETNKRIARLAYEAREAKKLARQMKQELEQLRSQQPQHEEDIDTKVARRAAEIAAANEFNKTCNDIYDKGVKEFGSDFQESVRHLNEQLGAIPPHMIEAAIDAGDAHKLLHHLAQNPDELDEIASLPPHRMGAALVKLSSKMNTKALPPVSKAPPPIKTIGGASKGEPDPSTMSIDEYMKWADEHDAKRRRGEI